MSTASQTCPAAEEAKAAGSVCSKWNEARWNAPLPCSPHELMKNCDGLFQCNDEGKGWSLIAGRPTTGDVGSSRNVKFATNQEAIVGGMGVLGECARRGEITDFRGESCHNSNQPGDFTVDLCTGPMSQAAMDTSNDRTRQSLINLENLQRMEKDLYGQLEELNARDASYEEQKKVMSKVDEVADMRISMFKGLSDMYTQTQESVSQTRVDLVDQLTVLGVVNAELDNARADLKQLEDARTGKVRMAEINTYYGKRYRAHANLMKLLVLVCLPVMAVVVLQKKGLLPSKIADPLLVLFLAIALFLVGARVIDLWRRNNMNYEEYDWAWDADANDPTVIQYDVQAMKSSDIGRSFARGVESAAEAVGKEFEFCVGGRCCGKGTYFDHKKGTCVSNDADRISSDDRVADASRGGAREGFDTKYLTQTSYVEGGDSACTWKKERTTVRPFNSSSLGAPTPE